MKEMIYVKKLLILVLALCVILCPTAFASSEITVQGTGTVRTAPDIAVISLGAEEIGEDVATIQAALNIRINAIIASLTGELGLEEADIQTGNYSIYRRYYDDYGNPAKDYVASCTLNVTVRQVEDAGMIIDAAFAAGANRLDNVAFSVEDDGSLSDKALELAVADAIHRAQVIAGASGLTLPAVPSRITESGDVNYFTNVSRASAFDESAKTTGTTIMSAMVKITATVTVTYVIGD